MKINLMKIFVMSVFAPGVMWGMQDSNSGAAASGAGQQNSQHDGNATSAAATTTSAMTTSSASQQQQQVIGNNASALVVSAVPAIATSSSSTSATIVPATAILSSNAANEARMQRDEKWFQQAKDFNIRELYGEFEKAWKKIQAPTTVMNYWYDHKRNKPLKKESSASAVIASKSSSDEVHVHVPRSNKAQTKQDMSPGAINQTRDNHKKQNKR